MRPTLPTELIRSLQKTYECELFQSVLPFWLNHARDSPCGGYAWLLNRDGSVFDWNKLGMWSSGRMIWMFSLLYNEHEQNPQWLDMSKHGVDFALRYGFNDQGWMYYALTRSGEPLEPPRDIFNELFHAMGLSEYGRAIQDDALAERGWQLFVRVWQRLQNPNQAFQPLSLAAKPIRMLGHALISLNVLSELRRYKERPEMPGMIDQCLDWLLNYHTQADQDATLEYVTWDGEPAPGFWGRWVRPGHVIEAGVFVIHEAEHRKDPKLLERGIGLIRQGYRLGWDTEFGGIVNDIDVQGKPIALHAIYMAPTKTWWQHAEAIYGLLLAYAYSAEADDLKAFQQVHDYTFAHFPDPEHGEWFGWADQRGNLMTDAKGLAHKSGFHVPRNLYFCLDLLRRAKSQDDT